MLPSLEAHYGVPVIKGTVQHSTPRFAFSFKPEAPSTVWDYKINNLRRVQTLQLSVPQPGGCAELRVCQRCLRGQKPEEKIDPTVSH